MAQQERIEVERKLAVAILSYLEKKSRESNVTEEQADSLLMARQCIQSAFDIPESCDISSTFAEGDKLLNVFEQSIKNRPSVDPEKAAAFKNEGNEFMRLGKFTDALEKYTEAIDCDSTNPVYYCNRAAAYMNLGMPSNCIADCERAIGIDHTYGKAYGRMGAAYLCMKKPEMAIQSLEASLRYDPDNQSSKSNLEKARIMQTNPHASEPTPSGRDSDPPAAERMSFPAAPDAADFARMFQNPDVLDIVNVTPAHGLQSLSPFNSKVTQMVRSPQMHELVMGMIRNQPTAGSVDVAAAAAAAAAAATATSTAASSTNPITETPPELSVEGMTRFLASRGQQLASNFAAANPALIDLLTMTWNQRNQDRSSQPGGDSTPP